MVKRLSTQGATELVLERRRAKGTMAANPAAWTKTGPCRQCAGCLTLDCGECINCLDKPKFGGPGTRRHACVVRVCERVKASTVPGSGGGGGGGNEAAEEDEEEVRLEKSKAAEATLAAVEAKQLAAAEESGVAEEGAAIPPPPRRPSPPGPPPVCGQWCKSCGTDQGHSEMVAIPPTNH